MKVFTEEVFEKVQNPKENAYLFNKMSKAEQLVWLTNFKEYLLEKKIYDKVILENTSVQNVFCNDAEIEADKKDLALTRYEMLKATHNTDNSYVRALSRHSYAFKGHVTEDVKLRFEIYRAVKGFSVRKYLPEAEQSAYCFF